MPDACQIISDDQYRRRRRRRPGARTRIASSSRNGSTRPSHSGQPWVPLPRGAAAQPGVADPHHPADHDQRERGDDRDDDEAAEAVQLAPARREPANAVPSLSGYEPPLPPEGVARRGVSALAGASGSREPASDGALSGGGGRQPSVRRRIASRMSRSGSGAADVRDASKLCGGGGDSANHSSVSAAPRVVPRADAVADAVDGVDQRHQDPRPRARTSRSTRRGCSRRGRARVVLVDVHRLALEAGEEHRQQRQVDADQQRHEREPRHALAHRRARSSSGTSSRGPRSRRIPSRR